MGRGWINPLEEYRNKTYVGTNIQWWDNPVLSAEEKTAILTRNTAINRWRGALCIPARY
jgi:hypothetical protein